MCGEIPHMCLLSLLLLPQLPTDDQNFTPSPPEGAHALTVKFLKGAENIIACF